jgi:hypothetical protein
MIGMARNPRSEWGGISTQNGPGAYQTDFRSSGAFFSSMATMRDGSSPHSKVQIWYSANVRDGLAGTSFAVPEGTVAIKTFDNDGTEGIDGIAVMVKKPAGFDPAHHDWHYEMRDPNGGLMSDPPPGPIDMCIGCHRECAQKDYLCGTSLR